jgi:hypothetical protein
MAVSHVLLGVVEADELIDIPIEATPAAMYGEPEVEIKLWGADLPTTLANIRAGLMAGNATLASGKLVKSNADAVRWALEQVCSAVTPTPG